MAKARALSRQLKIRIGRYKERNPKTTYGEVAAEFGVTYDQARTAHKQHTSGALRTSKSRSKRGKVEEIITTTTADELIERQHLAALAELELDKKLGVSDRIEMLDTLCRIAKSSRTMRLEAHLKRLDAGVIARIVRRYEPDATDERVIEVYREETELLRRAT